MADLPTNYYDDILSASMNGKKKFRLTYRNGTTEEVTIEDISEYDQYGSKFGAGDINKTNQAVNEKFDADDVVDPMLTTERGFAADAFLTGKELKKQEENLTASNGVPFKFGVNETGEYGHIVTDSEGADTFIPFSGKYRLQVIEAMQNTNMGLTEESTWDDIINALNVLFPAQLNLLSYLSGKWTFNNCDVSSQNPLSFDADSKGNATATSASFDITTYKSLSVTASHSRSEGQGGGQDCTYNAYLHLDNANKDISLNSSATIDLSGYTGTAYIYAQCMRATQYRPDGSSYTSSSSIYFSKLLLVATP